MFPEQLPESVADAIVQQVFSGLGDHIILPKSYGFLPGLVRKTYE